MCKESVKRLFFIYKGLTIVYLYGIMRHKEKKRRNK